jgi:hypothetical protein
MTEQKDKSPEVKPANPLFSFIDSNQRMGSVRELISHAIKDISPWDLPEDPAELKKVLSEAIDHADSLKKTQQSK